MNWYKKSERCSSREETQLKQVARKIRHCGDYGHLMWHERDRKVRWVMGDSDTEDNDMDSEDTIQRMFSKLPFVRHVETTDEWGSTETMGWRRLRY